MKRLVLMAGLLGLTVSFVPLTFAATISSMTKDEATKAFSDKTFSTVGEVTLNNQLIDNTFTGYFSKDGKMKGKFKDMPENEPQVDAGVWKVNDKGEICFKWDHWDSNKERCVTAYKLNNGFLIINSQNGFETLILNKDMSSGDSLK